MCKLSKTWLNIELDSYDVKDTTVPTPNMMVKFHNADGTAEKTLWESRSLPGKMKNTKYMLSVLSVF